ncbi:hypothetical protein [Yeosuana sp.]|uniref:hypothetical protein n=1 Tax=Yeosuana sp. TaxID=2529388 RepID=UPI004054D2C6
MKKSKRPPNWRMVKRNSGKNVKSVRFDGVNDIRKSFDSLIYTLADGRVNDILTENTMNIVTDAKMRSRPISSNVSASIGHIKKGNYPFNVLIGPHYPQGNLAHIFEYGTRPRYTEDGLYRGQIIATPFMRPAYDNGIGDSTRKIKEALTKEIKKIKDKL